MRTILFFQSNESLSMDELYQERGSQLIAILKNEGFEVEEYEGWDEPDYSLKCERVDLSFHVALVIYNTAPSKGAVFIENLSDEAKVNALLLNISNSLKKRDDELICCLIDQKELKNKLA